MTVTWMPKMRERRFFVCPAGKTSTPLIVNHEISDERARRYNEGDRKVVTSTNREIARIVRHRHRVQVDPALIIITLLPYQASASTL